MLRLAIALSTLLTIACRDAERDATLAASCRADPSCKLSGACAYRPTIGSRDFDPLDCGPATDADCAASDSCRNLGQCAIGPSRRCAPTQPEHCAQSFGCKRFGACRVGAHTCER